MLKDDAETLALLAFAHVIGVDDLRDRFLALTGYSADHLRTALEQSELLLALLEFLVNHEPDLTATAAAINISPQTLAAAHRTLAGHTP